MAEDFTCPPRLMNFVSSEQLDEAKRYRGEKVKDGTAYRDRPLFEVLREHKYKKDAEFNERFKHRAPKALDDEEAKFLDQYEISKKEYERRIADEEAQQLSSFRAAVAEKKRFVFELKETPSVQAVKEQQNSAGKKNPATVPPGMMFVKVKKARVDNKGIEEATNTVKLPCVDTDKTSEAKIPEGATDKSSVVSMTSLVSYSDDSEDD